MASKLLLTAKSDRIDIEVEAEAWKPLVLVGLNASLKSATARTFTTICGEAIGPTLKDYGAECEVKLIEGEGGSWFYKVVEDARVSMRFFLSQQELVNRIRDDLDVLAKRVPRDMEDEVKIVREELDKLVDRVLSGLLTDYIELKKLSNVAVLTELYQLDGAAKDFANSFKKIYGDKAEEITPENLLPLNVEVSNGKVHIVDKRLKSSIDSKLVSSSIASMLLFNYILLFLSVTSYAYKLLIVEEPEEALAPPQQVLLARILERGLKRAEELAPHSKAFVILTTHSPYIALGLRGATHYYMKYANNVFKAERAVPHRPFSLGDLALLETLTREGAPDER